MAKSASADELRNMRSQATEQMKMTVFYRYWVGSIIRITEIKTFGFSAWRRQFSRLQDRASSTIWADTTSESTPRRNTDPVGCFRDRANQFENLGSFLTSTTVLEDGKLQSQWVFEESFVDSTHAIAVCREVKYSSRFSTFKYTYISEALAFEVYLHAWSGC